MWAVVVVVGSTHYFFDNDADHHHDSCLNSSGCAQAGRRLCLDQSATTGCRPRLDSTGASAPIVVDHWFNIGYLVREIVFAHLGMMARHARDQVAADVDSQICL